MEELLDSLWGLSPLLEKVALIAMLAAVSLITWAFVKHVCKPVIEQNDIRLSNGWRGWALLGLVLLIIGIALDGFAIWVRLSGPGRF